jgi:hypothetical protein
MTETALTTTDTNESLPASNPGKLLEMAVERGADMDALEKLMDLQERWEARQAERDFNDALASFQAQCPPIMKRREASFKGQHAYYFASLDDIMREIKPLLQQCGLTVSFSSDVQEGAITVRCRVAHGIHAETSEMTVPTPSEMRVNDTQKMGAALSYARRYALCNALNIVVTDEDTDAAKLNDPISEKQVVQLSELLEQFSNSRQSKFLAAFEINDLADLPVSRFEQARAALKRKIEEGDTE